MKPTTTTGGEKTDGAALSAGRLLTVAISFSLGAILLCLGIPRTIAAWATIEGDTAFDRIWAIPPASDLDLKSGVAAFVRAIEWQPSGLRLIRLGVIEITQAQRLAATAPERAPLLEQAERHLLEGLSIDPANGFGWHVVAVVRQLRNAPPRRIAVAAMQSLDMAPSARFLWLPRARVLFAYAADLKEDELLSVHRQLRMIWKADPNLRQPLIVTAFSMGNINLLLTALEKDEEAKSELEKLTTTPLKLTTPLK